MDSAEKGLLSGAGNIGKESFEALNGKPTHVHIHLKTKFKKWTKEEIDGRILVSCQASRDGLLPFIDKKQPFGSMTEAEHHFSEMFYRATDGEGIMLKLTGIAPDVLGYDIVHYPVGTHCGRMVIRVCEVVG